MDNFVSFTTITTTTALLVHALALALHSLDQLQGDFARRVLRSGAMHCQVWRKRYLTTLRERGLCHRRKQ
eukprot:1157737-Pelagomonas_calceolata.AAC.11